MNGRVDDEIFENGHHQHIVDQLSEGEINDVDLITRRENVTFGYSQKTDNGYSIFVSTANAVVNVSGRAIKRVVLCVPSPNRHRCFITS